MKINKILYIVVFCLSFSSCNKWLTIDPTDQVSERQLYSNSEGYHNQMNGIYKAMAKPELYGREMTWGFMDALAQYYDFVGMRYTEVNAYSRGASGYEYDFALALQIINSVWESSYNVISNCNDVIAHAEMADSSIFVLKENERRLILGEAHALRAMLHFDILRMYAPAPVKNNDDAYIPYVKSFPVHIPLKIKNSEVLRNVIEDLEKAELLTASHDTINKSNITNLSRRLELSTPAGMERSMVYRGYRLNHYAIKALLARVHLYAGNKESAFKYADELIKMNAFKFSSSSSFSYGDVKLYSDIIFALYDNKFVDYYRVMSPKDNLYLALLDYDGIFGLDGKVETDGSGNVINDNRELRAKQHIYDSEEQVYRSMKMEEVSTTLYKYEYNNKLTPMLRISEMYYIAAECIFEKDSKAALKYLRDVRTARGAKKSVFPDDVQTVDEFNNLLLNEMRREMFGEGQLFFFYKRLNMNVVKKADEKLVLDKEFVLPIPLSNDIN